MSLYARVGPMVGIRGDASVPRRMQKSINAEEGRVVVSRSDSPEIRVRGLLELDTFRSNGAYIISIRRSNSGECKKCRRRLTS